MPNRVAGDIDDDLTALVARAVALRARFFAFLEDLGAFAPPFRQIHADLAEIDEHLASLPGASEGSGGMT
ncbi:MAG TPA: hypothetical protein VG826_05155 [Pirellulales bacterium]|nr:hypothetical protein [Pirellulales bacterium]